VGHHARPGRRRRSGARRLPDGRAEGEHVRGALGARQLDPPDHDERGAEVETSLEEYLPSYEADGHRAGDRSFLLADWSQSPEAELLSGEARLTLERALDALPETYRAVLVLRDVEELGNEEVAEMLGESIASVKSRLHRARMALREQLTRSLVSR